MTFLIIIYVAVVVLELVSMWKIFSKAGKPGWAIFIPIYDVLIFLEIVGKPWWWLLLMLIPGVNFVLAIWMVNLLSLSFGKTSAFTVGMIFLAPIFIPILGLGNAEYKGPAGDLKA